MGITGLKKPCFIRSREKNISPRLAINHSPIIMNAQSTHISESINVLNANLFDVAQVGEWADLMGYDNAKKFSRRFLRHYEVRPGKILVSLRLKSIYKELRSGLYSNFRIARRHNLPDEKGLNKFVNYHLSCCPSKLQVMPVDEFNALMEKFGSKIRE